MPEAPYIAVVGAGDAGEAEWAAAEEAGRLLGEAGAVVVTGGLGGVMQAASKGAREAGATTVGLLPGHSRSDANEYVQVALPTGLGEARNALVVRAADALIAVGGGWGTLSEIALARKAGKPVAGVGTWTLEGLDELGSPAEAVSHVLRTLAARGV